MPNSPINRDLSQALQSAFGGSSSAAVPQQPTPAPVPAGTSGAGSLWDAIKGYMVPQSPFKPNGGDGSAPIGKLVK